MLLPHGRLMGRCDSTDTDMPTAAKIIRAVLFQFALKASSCDFYS